MSWKKQFPPDDGWIRAQMTLSKRVTLKEAREIIDGFFRSPEIGQVDLTGKKLTVIYRQRETLKLEPGEGAGQ